MKIAFLGPPASGKGTYASRLSPIFGMPHISTGELFREIAKIGSKFGNKIAKIQEEGELVPDDITIEVLKERIAMPDCKKGFILDGFPRTIPQAEELGKITELDAVVNIDVPESVVMDRILYRVVCEKCGEIYSTKILKPKKEGICDTCGGKLVGRSDQTPETVKARLKEYHEKTEPLERYYKEKGLLIEIYNDQSDIDPQIMVDAIVSELKNREVLTEGELKKLEESGKRKTEQTLLVIKPDGVERGLVDEIIKRYTSTGLKVVKKKMMQMDEELAKKHYPDSMTKQLGEKTQKSGAKIESVVEHGKKVLRWLRKYISSSPVVVMIIEGENAIQRVRDITGYTDPTAAEKGTIRGDFGDDSILQATKEGRVVRNLIHASDNRKEAKREIKLWFG